MSELTVAQVAALVGVSEKAVRSRVARGTIRSTVTDGRRVIPESEVRRAWPECSPDSPAIAQTTDAAPAVDAVADLVARVDALAAQVEDQRQAAERAESAHAAALDAETRRCAALEMQIIELRARVAELEDARVTGRVLRRLRGLSTPRRGRLVRALVRVEKTMAARRATG